MCNVFEMSRGGASKNYGEREQIPPERIILNFPKCYNTKAQISENGNFGNEVQEACSTEAIQSIRIKMCKIILIGDLSVGKTSLVSRVSNEKFQQSYKATIGIDFVALRFDILKSPFTLHIWDTAGQERFQSVAAAYYRGAQVVTIVFDLSDKKSLKSAESWLESAKKENKNSTKLLVFLVGTKCDLVSARECKEIESAAIKIAQNMQAEYWKVSAKSGENVRLLFRRVAALSFELAVQRELQRRQSCKNPVKEGVNLRNKQRQIDIQSSSCCKD